MRKYLILLFVVNFLTSTSFLAWNDPTNSGKKSTKGNSVILRASLTHSSVDSSVDADSGNYELFICDTTKAVGAAQGGTSVEIADEIATTSSSVGTTTATSIQAVGNEQFIQLVTSADNTAENGVVKFVVAIQYAGMGEPIKI